MSLRGTAHKRTGRGPLMNLPDQRRFPLDSSCSGDSALRPQTDSSLHSADRTEEQGFRFAEKWNLNLQLSLTAISTERMFWTDLHCTLSLPENLNAGKPLSVRGLKAESPERLPSRQFTKGRRLSPEVHEVKLHCAAVPRRDINFEKRLKAFFFLSHRRCVFFLAFCTKIWYTARKTITIRRFL